MSVLRDGAVPREKGNRKMHAATTLRKFVLADTGRCARITHYVPRTFFLLLLFFWFSKTAGGGREALYLSKMN